MLELGQFWNRLYSHLLVCEIQRDGYMSSRHCISCKNVCLVFKYTIFLIGKQTKNPACSDLYPLFVSQGSMNTSEMGEFVQWSYFSSFEKANLEKIQWTENFFKAFLKKIFFHMFVCEAAWYDAFYSSSICIRNADLKVFGPIGF